MKIWSTKYCLTDGITEHEVVNGYTNNMVTIPKTADSYAMHLHGEGKDWHKSKEAAVRRANVIRIKKLQSLDKQVEKISAIEFD